MGGTNFQSLCFLILRAWARAVQKSCWNATNDSMKWVPIFTPFQHSETHEIQWWGSYVWDRKGLKDFPGTNIWHHTGIKFSTRVYHLLVGEMLLFLSEAALISKLLFSSSVRAGRGREVWICDIWSSLPEVIRPREEPQQVLPYRCRLSYLSAQSWYFYTYSLISEVKIESLHKVKGG